MIIRKGENYRHDADLENFRSVFLADARSARTTDDCRQIRRNAAYLLASGTLHLDDYASMFGGRARYMLTRSADGTFRYAESGDDAGALATRYSRAKHGSSLEITQWVDDLIVIFLRDLEQPGTTLNLAFSEARSEGHYVVLFGTGMRNAAAASNLMCERFVEEANMELSLRGYPTIAHVRLPRIAPPCENYSQLTPDERIRVSLEQDHVLPDSNFYAGTPVHVIFADDVLVTGATGDKVFASAMANGARSFTALYPVVVDPAVALSDPDVEHMLNTFEVGKELDDDLIEILKGTNHPPVLRTLRLVFSQAHSARFAPMLSMLSTDCLRLLYRSAVSADFYGVDAYSRALLAFRNRLGYDV